MIIKGVKGLSHGSSQIETPLKSRIRALHFSISEGSYRIGDWQTLLRDIEASDIGVRSKLREDITMVSAALHSRHNYPTAPFLPIYIVELAILVGATAITIYDSLIPNLLATLLLAVTLQPTLKVTTGLILGVRYSHAYLWYFEPRFKMKYGDYVSRPTWQRLLINFVGSVGTPLAMIIGLKLLAENAYLFWVCAMGLIAFSMMQIVAFSAALAGITRLGPFTLRHLTTPAMLGFEIRERLR